MCKEIYLDAPNVGVLEKKYLNNAIDTGFVSTVGPFVSEFEEKFAKYVRVKRAVSVQSGTAALHISLKELGIGKGDEVIVPVLTFVATVNPVIHAGAKPVFVDVDSRTWNIAPEEIEENITEKTKAIIPVHLYGNPCDMDKIARIAKKHDVYIIEDATESLGAMYRNKHTGTFGDLGCFSFNGNKTITTGGGGMAVSRDNKKVEHIKFLVNQARDESLGCYHPEVGFNYRMTNIEAALGLAQMERMFEFLKKKKAFNRIYREELKGIGSLLFQKEYEGAESSWWLTCVGFSEEMDIVALQARLKEKGVPTRRVFMPVVEFPPYKKYRNGNFNNSFSIYQNALCLPGSTLNSTEDIHYVCDVLKDIVSE